jgi:protein-tyrosine phosphatase
MPGAPYRIVFICVGNVCRSPLAERLLGTRLDELLGDAADWATVASAGVRAMVGHAMDTHAAAELVQRGGDPAGFASRQVTAAMVEEADLVLTATQSIRSRVLEESPRALRRTFTLLELAAILDSPDFWDGRPTSVPDLVARAATWRGAAVVEEYDVTDPIGADPAVHHEVAEVIDRACTTIARAIAEVELSDLPAG